MTTNDLVRGDVYRATTVDGSTIGEYLGVETTYGEMAILLRRRGRTTSVDLSTIRAIATA